MGRIRSHKNLGSPLALEHRSNIHFTFLPIPKHKKIPRILMSKKTNVNISGRRKRRISDSPTPFLSTPPCLVPCAAPENSLFRKLDNIRKFAFEMATKDTNRPAIQLLKDSRTQPTHLDEALDQHASMSSSEESENAYYDSLFKWMCSMSPSGKSGEPRRSKRISLR